MPANIDGIIREGIAAFKAGRKDEARVFLLRAVELDQYSEQAWLWLSAVVDGKEDQRTCLENVLAINPDNERARAGLAVLNEGAETSPFPASTPSEPSDFPTSVEWADDATPVADADPKPPPVDVPAQDYDSWIDNLNLPASSSTESSDPFGGVSLDSDPFGGTFSPDDEDVDDGLGGNFSDDDPFSSLDFETVFGEPDAAAVAPPPLPPEPPPAPAPTVPAAAPQPPTLDDEDDDPFAGVDLPPGGVFADLPDDDYTDAELADIDAEELFQYIPANIKPTRLPGTRERYPVVLVLAVVLLVLLNAGALALLAYRLL